MKATHVHTIEEFNAWLKSAQQNDRVIYHIGRYAETWGNGGMRKSIADVAYEASERGEVVLFQERAHEWGRFKYTATRSRTPVSVQFWLSPRVDAWLREAAS